MYDCGWLYMIQKRDHRKQHDEIYIMGVAKDFNRRINEYPGYSQIISVCPVDNDKKCKRDLIKKFINEFEFRNNIGHEYFEGDERDMIYVFKDYFSEHLRNREEEVDMDYHLEIEGQR
jgi:hypothetical protein